MRADADGLHYRAHFVRTRQHDHVEAAIDLHQLFQRFDAAQLRHQHIENNEIRALPGAHLLDGFFSGADRFHLKTVNLQQRLQIFSNARFIVDDENLFLQLFCGHLTFPFLHSEMLRI